MKPIREMPVGKAPFPHGSGDPIQMPTGDPIFPTHTREQELELEILRLKQQGLMQQSSWVPNAPPEPLSAEDESALRQLRGDLAWGAQYNDGQQKQLEAFDRLTGARFK